VPSELVIGASGPSDEPEHLAGPAESAHPARPAKPVHPARPTKLAESEELAEPAELASVDAVVAALARAGRLGDYFSIGSGDAAGPWRPAEQEYGDGLRGQIDHTARQLGVGQRRVAASIAHLGYAARIWSPVLACALGSGIVPDLADLQVSADPPVRLRLHRPGGWHCAEPEIQAELGYSTVVAGHLEPLAAGLDARIASGLLWGNAASAMIGALDVIVHASPDLAGPARTLADLLLRTGQLHGTGQFTGPGLNFRRSSCCLYYRVPDGGLCGDCSLSS
jgi:ferric iron reductase protein FhuF